MEQLFTRDGDQFLLEPAYDNGRPVRYVPISCDRCTVIRGVRVWCRGLINGQPFSNTGFDCWACSNTGVRGERKERLYTAKELARVNKVADTRKANRAAKVAAAVAQAAIERAKQEAEYRAQNADFLAKIATLCTGNGSDFWDRLAADLLVSFRSPSERQIALVDAEVAKRKANACSDYFGAAGDKVTLVITVERIIALHSQIYGTNWITIARTDTGSVVTYKGRTDLGRVGETVTVKAVVKEHTVYNGVKQTVIQRPKKVVDTV